MTKLDNLDKLFVVWAFLFQIALIAVIAALTSRHTVFQTLDGF